MKENPNSFWTEGRDDVVRKFYGIKSARQLAAELGTTKNAVIGRMRELRSREGIKYDKNRPVTLHDVEYREVKRAEYPPTDKVILTLWRQSMDTSDIAKALWIPESEVAKRLPPLLEKDRQDREWDVA